LAKQQEDVGAPGEKRRIKILIRTVSAVFNKT